MNSQKEKGFYYLTIFFILVLAAMIYISVTLPSKEEFIELHWQVFMTENLTNSTQVSCVISNCSISGIYRIGDIALGDKTFRIIITDLEMAGLYDSICIDFNHNGNYCEVGEGPFRERNSFFIDSFAFNILAFMKDGSVIVNYPKEVDVNNFAIGYVIKSHYSETIKLNVNLFVNETLQTSGIMDIDPKQEITLNDTVFLPTKGLFSVKIIAVPLEVGKEVYIDFWVENKA